MGSHEDIKDDVVQFARYAASGDMDSARVFGMRRVRQLSKTDPALAHALREALTAQPAKTERTAGSLRRATPAWESNSSSLNEASHLIRLETPTPLSFVPTYASEVMVALSMLVREHTDSRALKEAGLSAVRTAIFSGPPGVGKTLAARWISQQLDRPLLILDLGTVMSRYLGATGSNLKRAFAYALDSNGILFLDELDALAKRRDDSTDIGELKRLVTVLLQELDDWPSDRLLLAATNHSQLLDDAVWRRFEVRLELPRPTEDDLRRMLESVADAGRGIPQLWGKALPILFAGTSHSDFMQALLRLRKSAVLEPETKPAEALIRVCGHRVQSLSRDDARTLAIALAKEKGISLRKISEFTHVSRETMRRAGIRRTK